MKSKALFLVVLSIFFLSSCTKSKESTLEGKWRKVEVTNIGVPQPTTIWEFHSGILTVSEIPLGVDTIIEQSKAKYNVGFNGEHYTLNILNTISGQDLAWIAADGKIKELNDDYFKWFNKNGFYGEFVRAE
jgi:hypothetical protein